MCKFLNQSINQYRIENIVIFIININILVNKLPVLP